MTASARARRLVAQIERAIERGEFTPNSSYLYVRRDIGPCGCARAAAQFVSGVRAKEADADASLDQGDVPGLSPEEADALEAGYEDRRFFVDKHREFYAAGKELRKFHPFAFFGVAS